MGELLVLTDARRRAAMERSVDVGAPNGATTVSPLTTDPYLASEIRLRATVEYFENKVRSGMNQASVPMDKVVPINSDPSRLAAIEARASAAYWRQELREFHERRLKRRLSDRPDGVEVAPE